MGTFKYSEWDGSQNIFNMDADELMDKVGDDLMSNDNIADIMRRMMRNGMRNSQGQRLPGMQEMMQRLKQKRQQQLDKYNLGSIMDDIKEKLKEIQKMEREGIQEQLEKARQRAEEGSGDISPEMRQKLKQNIEDRAKQNLEKMDGLPKDPGGQIKELNDYDFMDAEARQKFQELMDQLKKHAMESFGKDMMQKLQNMDPSALANMRNMLEAMNQMMEQRMNGKEPDFKQFMEQFGSYFGDDPPKNLDELMERMQQQMAQAQALMNSLSPKDREALQEMMDSMLDEATKMELAKLARNLETLMPSDNMDKQYSFDGKESISYSEALKLMEELEKMDKLEDQMRDAQRGSVDKIDPDLFKDVMGEESSEEMKQLREMMKMLEEAGYVRLKNGKYELTPQGMRKIGQKALSDIFSQLKKDRFSGHTIKMKGRGGEKLDETKKFEFGDDLELDFQKTLMNALQRDATKPPIKLSLDDFEINQYQSSTRTAIVLMLDMSLSMFMRNYFESAKRTAIALDSLIRSQFPKDTLHIIGFSQYARVLKKEDLFYVGQDQYDHGTNIHHALLLAEKLLAKEGTTNKQIIIISDGEPTAHIEDNQIWFQYPPTLRTMQLTLREVKNCTKKGIVINTFMLDDSAFLSSFVTRMASLNKGRVFFADAENLGKYILVDYLNKKKKVID